MSTFGASNSTSTSNSHIIPRYDMYGNKIQVNHTVTNSSAVSTLRSLSNTDSSTNKDVFQRLEERMKRKDVEPMDIDEGEEEEEEEEENNAEARKMQWLEERAAPISDADKQRVKSLIQRGGDAIIIEKYNIPIRPKDLKTLSPGCWLNDEIVSFYMQLLQERDKTLVAQFNQKKTGSASMLPSHFFNHFFINIFF